MQQKLNAGEHGGITGRQHKIHKETSYMGRPWVHGMLSKAAAAHVSTEQCTHSFEKHAVPRSTPPAAEAAPAPAQPLTRSLSTRALRNRTSCHNALTAPLPPLEVRSLQAVKLLAHGGHKAHQVGVGLERSVQSGLHAVVLDLVQNRKHHRVHWGRGRGGEGFGGGFIVERCTLCLCTARGEKCGQMSLGLPKATTPPQLPF